MEKIDVWFSVNNSVSQWCLSLGIEYSLGEAAVDLKYFVIVDLYQLAI